MKRTFETDTSWCYWGRRCIWITDQTFKNMNNNILCFTSRMNSYPLRIACLTMSNVTRFGTQWRQNCSASNYTCLIGYRETVKRHNNVDCELTIFRMHAKLNYKSGWECKDFLWKVSTKIQSVRKNFFILRFSGFKNCRNWQLIFFQNKI